MTPEQLKYLGNLGVGLMGASGPSRMPVSFGQAFASASQQADEKKRLESEDQYKQALLGLQLKKAMKTQYQRVGNDLIDPESGKLIYRAPNTGGGADGGVLGYAYNKFQNDPKFKDFLYNYQTGFRKGTGLDEQGNVIPMAGYGEAMGTNKYGEQSGVQRAKQEFAAPIAEQTAIGKASGEAQGAIKKKEVQAPQVIDLVERAEKLLPNASSGAVEGTYTAANNMIGRSTPASQADAELNVIAAGLTSNVPRMEGPQSDKDTQMYREAAANVGNRNLPAETRKAALLQVKSIAQKYALQGKMNGPVGGGEPAGGGIKFLGFEGQ